MALATSRKTERQAGRSLQTSWWYARTNKPPSVFCFAKSASPDKGRRFARQFRSCRASFTTAVIHPTGIHTDGLFTSVVTDKLGFRHRDSSYSDIRARRTARGAARLCLNTNVCHPPRFCSRDLIFLYYARRSCLHLILLCAHKQSLHHRQISAGAAFSDPAQTA